MKNKLNFYRQLFRTLLTCVMFLSYCSIAVSSPKKNNKKNTPLFSNFRYEGDDNVYREKPLNDNEFYSVILQGCYLDPSICRKGEDYYLVCLLFAMFLIAREHD